MDGVQRDAYILSLNSAFVATAAWALGIAVATAAKISVARTIDASSSTWIDLQLSAPRAAGRVRAGCARAPSV